MSEIQVWEHILKWGHAQNPELSTDPTSLSKEDFNILKNTLQQCIPFIKFYNLNSKEFTEKVLPYKKILPKELYKDLFKTFLLLDKDSSNLKNIDSKIISVQHADLISKWIDRLEINDDIKNPYKLKLLFRASRDGSTVEKFHEICDGQSHTVAIVKVQNSNEILGGYNPIEWKSRNFRTFSKNYCATKDSFIFSFKNNDKIENYVLSRVVDEFAVYNYYNC